MTYEYMRGNGTGEATTEVFYTYDELHQVVTAKENYGNKSRSYQYDSLGNLTLETNSNNVTVDYKLNNLNQITTSSDDGWKTSTAYSYDKRGNLIQELYTKGKKQSVTGAYTFDETNKMVKGVNDLGESSVYLYNGLGALVEQTWTIKKNSYGYHDGSETAALTAQEGTETESGADAEAQAAAPTPDAGTTLLDELDAMGDPAAALDAESGIMPLKNDHSDKKPDDKPGHKPNQMITVVKQFFPDYTRETLDSLVENEVGGLEYRYVYGNERLSVNITGIENGTGSIMENGNQVRLYYHQDLRGTVDYLTSPVSQKIESWTHYNEWGEITHNAVLKCGQRELDLVKNYTGHEYDAVLGMYYAKARFYDAAARRFISMDPVKGDIKKPLTLIQYLYVENNPLIQVDPLGKEAATIKKIKNLQWGGISSRTYNGSVYYSVREIFDALGGIVIWDDSTKQADLSYVDSSTITKEVHLKYNTRNVKKNFFGFAKNNTLFNGDLYAKSNGVMMDGIARARTVSLLYYNKKVWMTKTSIVSYFENVWYDEPKENIPVPPTSSDMTISENGLKILADLELKLTTDPTSPYYKLFRCEGGKVVGIYPYYVGDNGITFGFGHYMNKAEYNSDSSEKALYDKYIPQGTPFDDGKGMDYYPRVVPNSSYMKLDDAYALLRSDAELHSDKINSWLKEANIQQSQNQFDALVCYRFLHGNLGTTVMNLIETNASKSAWTAAIAKDNIWKSRHLAIIELYFTK